MTVTIFSSISTQHCEVLFHSYGHTVNDYTLKWDRNEKGEVKKKTFLKQFLTQALVQVLSTHSPDIVLDKYNFELGYDDDFDMGGFRIILIEITLKDDYIIESLIDVECRM